MRFRWLLIWTITMALLVLTCGNGWAAFGEDVEKPQPKFQQEGGDWIAELIPRGKSSNIQIRFHAEGGTLAEPIPKEFEPAEIPNIDLKNYRSGFFLLNMIPSEPGGDITLSLASSYFNSATDIWGVTERSSRIWGTTGIVNTTVKDEPAVLKTVIRDGSPLDEDGLVNGKIQVIIGPRDHFWGYAIGTLVIRFFGVFLVLGILMIGMMISGKIFESLYGAKKPLQAAPPMDSLAEEPKAEDLPDLAPVEEIAPPVAVAIGLALHLHACAGHTFSLSDAGSRAAAVGLALHLHAGSTGEKLFPADSETRADSNWSLSGRNQLMTDRQSAFDRVQNK